MYGRQLAAVWDLFYQEGRGKDYAAEAEEVSAVVLTHRPDAARLLDVACGTGAHLTHFSKRFAHVEGLDLSAAMVDQARAKLSGVPVHQADMRDFRLGSRFDAVVCLNTGVAYLPSLADLRLALRRMARHLAPGGVLVVEPWWFPARFLDGYVAGDIVRARGLCVSRISRTLGTGGRATMDIHYVVADETGIEHFTEVHVFGLWSEEQYLQAFAESGLTARYAMNSVSGYGMFVAVHEDGVNDAR